MKSNIKKLISILSIVVLLLLILIIIIFINKEKLDKMFVGEGRSATFTLTDGNIIKEPENRADCFTAINIAKEYINYLSGDEEDILMNVISSEYIKEHSIKKENILNKVRDDGIVYSTNYNTVVKKVYIAKESMILQTFFVDLLYYNKDNNQKYDIKIIIQMDFQNQTYQIMPYSYMKYKKYDELTLGDTVNTGVTTIENKKYNKFSLAVVSKDATNERYFNMYLDLMKYYPEQAYSLLKTEYREKRFESIENFKKYTSRIDYDNLFLESYKTSNLEEGTRFLCIDNENNYYIFYEKNLMNFEVILDVYTVDVEEFTEKYYTLDASKKVMFNIKKLIEATKNDDYKYAYNKLNESFKNSNFPTLESFEKFIKGKFDVKEDTIKYKNYEEIAGAHVYDIQVTDKSENKTINAKVVMKLKENMEFEFSFSVEQ